MEDKPRRLMHAITEERKRVFLETLAKTGSVSAAAAHATPWSEDKHGGSSTFRDLRQRDPEFAHDWERALERAQATVESELMRRAMEPTTRPVFSKGELVGEELRYDNGLLLRIAAKLDPSWSERSRVEHSGEVMHQHAVAVLQPSDVLLLEPDDRETFLQLVEKIATAKKGQAEALAIPAEASPR